MSTFYAVEGLGLLGLWSSLSFIVNPMFVLLPPLLSVWSITLGFVNLFCISIFSPKAAGCSQWKDTVHNNLNA
jgi:hypothetical protein